MPSDRALEHGTCESASDGATTLILVLKEPVPQLSRTPWPCQDLVCWSVTPEEHGAQAGTWERDESQASLGVACPCCPLPSPPSRNVLPLPPPVHLLAHCPPPALLLASTASPAGSQGARPWDPPLRLILQSPCWGLDVSYRLRVVLWVSAAALLLQGARAQTVKGPALAFT